MKSGVSMSSRVTRKRFLVLFVAGMMSLSSMVLTVPTAHGAAKVSKSEYQAYIKTMKSLVSAESSILRKYGSVTGDNYSDDETMYEVFVNLTPEINRFIGRIERVQPKNSTLRSIHNLYVAGWNLQNEAVLLSLQALEDQSYAGMAQSNKVLSQGRAKLNEYRARLQGLGY